MKTKTKLLLTSLGLASVLIPTTAAISSNISVNLTNKSTHIQTRAFYDGQRPRISGFRNKQGSDYRLVRDTFSSFNFGESTYDHFADVVRGEREFWGIPTNASIQCEELRVKNEEKKYVVAILLVNDTDRYAITFVHVGLGGPNGTTRISPNASNWFMRDELSQLKPSQITQDQVYNAIKSNVKRLFSIDDATNRTENQIQESQTTLVPAPFTPPRDPMLNINISDNKYYYFNVNNSDDFEKESIRLEPNDANKTLKITFRFNKTYKDGHYYGHDNSYGNEFVNSPQEFVLNLRSTSTEPQPQPDGGNGNGGIGNGQGNNPNNNQGNSESAKPNDNNGTKNRLPLILGLSISLPILLIIIVIIICLIIWKKNNNREFIIEF